MIEKYLISIDEQSQSAVLELVRTNLQKEGIKLIYMEFNPLKYQKREDHSLIFDEEKFKNDLVGLPYFRQIDSIVCDYNLIDKVIDGFQIIKIIKEINPYYKKQIILYSAKIDMVIDDILSGSDFELKKKNLRSLIDCNIDFHRRDVGYEQNVIKHIKKDKEFNPEEELINWFYSRKNDTFNYLFPKYSGKTFCEIADLLKNGGHESVEFKKEIIEQITSYLLKINSLE